MTTGLIGLSQFRAIGLSVLPQAEEERLRTSVHLLEMLQTSVADYLNGPDEEHRQAMRTVVAAVRLHLQGEAAE